MPATIYDGLPTYASEAFHGRIDEAFAPITEADLDDDAVKVSDLEDLAEMDDDHGDYDPDGERYDSAPSRFGMDFGDEDAIFGRGL